MRLGVQFSGPRTVVSIGLERGETESSAGFARWGWDWLAPDLSLYPIVSAYVVMGRARTPERQNASAPGLVKGRLEYQSGFWTISVRCAGKWVFLCSRLFSLFARPSPSHGKPFLSHPLGTLPPFIGFLLVSRVGLWLQWTRIWMNRSSDEYVKSATNFMNVLYESFCHSAPLRIYRGLLYFYKYRITLSTESITSTLLRVFYIFVYYKILRILVSLNFPLIRKNS